MLAAVAAADCARLIDVACGSSGAGEGAAVDPAGGGAARRGDTECMVECREECVDEWGVWMPCVLLSDGGARHGGVPKGSTGATRSAATCAAAARRPARGEQEIIR